MGSREGVLAHQGQADKEGGLFDPCAVCSESYRTVPAAPWCGHRTLVHSGIGPILGIHLEWT